MQNILTPILPGATDGGSAPSDDERLDAILQNGSIFQPADKYSPLKMQPTDGWANGNSDDGAAATHDASAGAVPSYTTAKKRQICIATVAGTLNGKTVGKGDLLMALQDNPTTAAHWAIIRDCTTEFDAAMNAAQGGDVWLFGTFIMNSTTLNVPISLRGDYTILNRCGYPAIYTSGNNTRAAQQTPRQCASAGLGAATGIDVDDEIGTTLQHVTYFTLNTVAHAADFKIGQKVKVFTDAVHIAESGSSKGYVSNSFVVTSVDLTNGIVYADRVIQYHNKIANATNIYLIPLHEDRTIRIRPGALFMGCPTIIGGQVGWWLTLDGSTPIAATISGSGSSRTLTFSSNLDWVALQGVRIGSVSGVPEASCRISSVNAGANQVTITVSSTNDKGQAWTAPTSGTVYVVPAFWTSEFDSTTHGGAVILQQAHGSDVECELARLWSSGVRIRFSHYCRVKVRPSKTVNIGTGISGKSWRLTYDVETYSASRNDIDVESQGHGMAGRHPYTSSSGTTSTTWASTHWQFRSGCTCENKIKTRTKGDSGPAADTHAMTGGDDLDSEVEFPTTYNTAHSYRGIGAQLRSDNTRIKHKQKGGQIGLRIANGSSYVREPGSIDEIDLEVSDLPLRSDAHAFHPSGSSGNLPCGFMAQSQSSYTDKTLTTGRMNLKNAACGFNLENSCRGRFDSVTHNNVGYAIGWAQTASDLYIAEVNADYTLSGAAETTSSSSVALGTGSKSFTITAGLSNFSVGQNVLVQDAANPRSNYGWGRIVSYTSTSLVVYIEGVKGSGTIASWVITSGAVIPRYGIVLSGTATVTVGVMRWRVGAGANPLEVFHSKDSTSGKIVNVGILIVDDPLLKGMPSIVTSGREADFTRNIGMVIYNGKIISLNGTPQGVGVMGYVSGRWFPSVLGSSSNSSYSATGEGTIAMLTPFYVSQRTTFDKIGMSWITNTVATALKMGIYQNNNGALGSLIVAAPEITGISTSIAAATEVSATFSTPVTLDPGWYFLAALPNGAVSSFSGTNGTGLSGGVMGLADLAATGDRRPEITGLTYSSGLPSSGSFTRNGSSSVYPNVYLRAQ